MVRIPDGNHMRVLNAAVRESLRFRLLLSQVDRLRTLQPALITQGTLVFGRPPGLLSYRTASERLALQSHGQKPELLLYPEPSLNSALRAALEIVLGINVRTVTEHLALS